jgi:hypothetical protein
MRTDEIQMTPSAIIIKSVNLQIFHNIGGGRGNAVVQLVAVRFRMPSLRFVIDLILPAALQPWGRHSL